MTLTVQFYTLLAMIGMGGWIGASIDTYSRFLKRNKHTHWVVFINDILFWIALGLIVFFILLLVNEGELRFYVFLALVCGYAAYQSLFRSLYLQLLEQLIQVIVRIYYFLANAFYFSIVRPIKYLINISFLILTGLWKICLYILLLTYKIVRILLKVFLLPLEWLLLLFWGTIPRWLRNELEKIFSKIAGILRKIQNMNAKYLRYITGYIVRLIKK